VADYFFDSSALAKAYIAETGTIWVRTILDDEQHQIYISQVAPLEVVAALTRRFHVGDLTLQERNDAAREVRNDCLSYLVVDVTDECIEAAIDLALKHNPRAYDAVQLASALIVSNVLSLNPQSAGVTLVSADLELNSAGSSDGLHIEDPNSH
jgi:predicted nucleic acid-binding protein